MYAFYLPVFEGFDASGTPIYADTNGDGTVDTNFDQPGGQSDRKFVTKETDEFTKAFKDEL